MASLYQQRDRGGSPRARHVGCSRGSHGLLPAIFICAQLACTQELLDPTLDRIEVSPSTATLEIGATAQLSARAFDENGNDLTYGNLEFRWSSMHAQYVEVDPTGQTVTVRGLQEYVNAGTTGWTDVEVRLQGRPQPVGTARIMVSPVYNIQVTPSPIDIAVGESLSITAEATTSTGASVSVPTTWTVDDAAIASISGSAGANATTLVGLAPGTATLRALVGTKESGPVTVTVAEPPPEPGSLQGTVTDEAASGVEGLVVRIGGPTPSRTATDTDGKYYATELQAGSYTLFVQGVSGLRYLSTEVHQVGVQAGSSTVEDLTTTEGSFLRVESGQGDRQVAAGATATLVLEFLVWNRSGCPGCEPALILGVDGEPMTLHRFGAPGAYPGTSYTASLQVTAPAQAGTYKLYAMLVTGISTGSDAGKEAALNAYRDRYGNGEPGGVWVETFVPLGSLIVN